MAEESGLIPLLIGGIEGLMPKTTEMSGLSETPAELLKCLTECLKEFTTNLIGVVTEVVKQIIGVGNEKCTITLEAKTVCRELLAMLTRLCAYLKKVDNLGWYTQRKERKAMVLDSLKQEEPNLKPLNGYLKQLERRAEASFKIFTDHCDEAIKRLNEVHEDCKGAADKAKLDQAIIERAGGAFAGTAVATGFGIGGTALATGISLSVAVGLPTLGVGTLIGLIITGTVSPIVGLGVGGATAGITHAIATEFNDKEKALIALGKCFGKIEESASIVQQTAGKLLLELTDITEQIEDIEYFKSDQVSLMESMEKFFEELDNFAISSSQCHEKLTLKQQDLENLIYKVIGM